MASTTARRASPRGTGRPNFSPNGPATPLIVQMRRGSLFSGAAPRRRSPLSMTTSPCARGNIVIEGGLRPSAGAGAGWNGDPQRIWTINGVAGPVSGEKFGKPVLSVKRGTPVVLAMTNRTAFPQAIHVHGHSFRLLHAFDDGWDPYWLDTMILLEEPDGPLYLRRRQQRSLAHRLRGCSSGSTPGCPWFEVT